jgi:uncharacterized protein
MNDNIELTKRAYAALDEDDIAGFLQFAHPQIEWRYPDTEEVEFKGTWRGHEGVERFMETHDQAEEILELTTNQFVAQDDRVVVLGFYRGRAKSTGKEWQTDFAHVLTFAEGKIRRFQALFDTAAAVRARAG